MLEDLKAKIAALPEQVANEFISTLNDYTPVRTGTLQQGNRYVIEGTTIKIINEVEYFDYVNQGTAHIRPRLFVDSALNEMDQVIKRAWEKS